MAEKSTKAWLLAPLALLIGSCRTPTQIELVIMTDLSCDELADVSITAGAPDGVETAAPTTVTQDCSAEDGGSRVGTLVLAPAGDAASDVAIRVIGASEPGHAEQCTADNGYAGCIVSRRRLNYVPHTELRLRIDLSRACIDVACSPDTTCVDGTCKSATIPDPSKCEGKGCDEDILEGGGGAGGTGGAGGGGPVTLTPLTVANIPGATASCANGVSPDGTVVVGQAVIDGLQQPVVWRDGTARPLPIGAIANLGFAYDVSAGGDVVVGQTMAFKPPQASAVRWLWDANAGEYSLDELTSSQLADSANGVSADGRTIVGVGPGTTAHVWVDGFVAQDNSPDQLDCIDDGATVAGGERPGVSGVLVDLTNPGQVVYIPVPGTVRVDGISSDGVIGVGFGSDMRGFYVDVESSTQSAIGLAGPGETRPVAVARSSSGALRIVGRCDEGTNPRACVWTDTAQPWFDFGPNPTAPTWAVAEGLDLQGINLQEARDISAAGDVIVGCGSMNGGEAGWRLDVPPLGP
ncbi:MAG: hypothetical protein HOV80_04365 [Polyangiaceae bacterium]|nr:hypothetical protein [Polyangiaceae bacterium]